MGTKADLSLCLSQIKSCFFFFFFSFFFSFFSTLRILKWNRADMETVENIAPILVADKYNNCLEHAISVANLPVIFCAVVPR